jgi:hypothetical protein
LDARLLLLLLLLLLLFGGILFYPTIQFITSCWLTLL